MVIILGDNLCVGTTIDEAKNTRDAELKVVASKYDLVLLDISKLECDGLDFLKRLHKRKPKLPILVHSTLGENQCTVRAITLGAVGYITIEELSDKLVGAAQNVLSGGRYISPSLADCIASQLYSSTHDNSNERLSDREFQILRMIGAGKTSAQIADTLFISVKTVRTHRTKLMQKMKMRKNSDLINYAVKNNLIT